MFFRSREGSCTCTRGPSLRHPKASARSAPGKKEVRQYAFIVRSIAPTIHFLDAALIAPISLRHWLLWRWPPRVHDFLAILSTHRASSLLLCLHVRAFLFSLMFVCYLAQCIGLRCCDQGGSTSDAKRLLAKLWGWLPFGIRWAEKTVSMEAVNSWNFLNLRTFSETLCPSAVSRAGALQVSTCHAHSSRNGMMFLRDMNCLKELIGAIKIIREGVSDGIDGEMWDSSAKESECDTVFSAAIVFCTRRMDSLLWWILRVAGKRRAWIVFPIFGALANSIVDLGIRQGLKVK